MSDSGTDEKFSMYREKSLETNGIKIRSFQPKAITGQVIHDYNEVKEKFGSLASTDPSSNAHFTLNLSAKKSLGVEHEEKSHIEELVNNEVQARLLILKEEAYEEGFKKGRVEGRANAEKEFYAETKPLFGEFTELFQSFDSLKTDLYNANENFLIQLVYQVSRHVLLKELNVDREYVKRLTSMLVEKVGAKEHIRIKLSQKDFANMESIRDFLKAQYPDLKNVQFEVGEDLVLGGCKVETDLSRVNANVEVQLKAIEASLGEA